LTLTLVPTFDHVKPSTIALLLVLSSFESFLDNCYFLLIQPSFKPNRFHAVDKPLSDPIQRRREQKQQQTAPQSPTTVKPPSEDPSKLNSAPQKWVRFSTRDNELLEEAFQVSGRRWCKEANGIISGGLI
jgi:hypothetical protein